MGRYTGIFASWKDVQKQFNTDHMKPDKVYYADYDTGNWSGSAEIYFKHNKKYYYVRGGHCSCYGLEGQFQPEEFETRELFLAWLRRKIKQGDDIAKTIKRMVVAEEK